METMNITLVKNDSMEQDEVTKDMPVQEEGSASVSGFISGSLGGSSAFGNIATKIPYIGLIVAGYKLAKKGFEKISAIEKESRALNDTLRQYGGGNFSSNSFGDRINIFGRQIKGESVAYKK